MTATFLSWLAIALPCGTLSFSLWIGKRFLNIDIRDVGDHNPSTTNVLPAGGCLTALLTDPLDDLKAAIPGRHFIFLGSLP